MNIITKESINYQIDRMARIEKLGRPVLGKLSRDLLEYLMTQGSTDIASVNRLLGVLTPANRKACVSFFKYFLPWKYDEEKGEFGKRNKHLVTKRQARCSAFLLVEENTIWTWKRETEGSETTVSTYQDRIKKLVASALKGTKKTESLTAAEILACVLEVEGISVEDMIPLVEAIKKDEENKDDEVEMKEAA